MHRFASRCALLSLALGVVSFVPAAFAQDSGAPADSNNATAQQHRPPNPQKQAARLAKRLGLSDDQTSKLTAVLQDRQRQLDAVRSDSSLAWQERRAKLRSIQQGADAQINAVLTPDQHKQYVTLKENMRQRRQSARLGPDASGTDSGLDGGSH